MNLQINFLKFKNGELTTQQIVLLIVLILSFVVILFFIFRLNPGEISDREICRNSVVLVSKSNNFVSELDCRTNYLCISKGEVCENFVYKTKVNVQNKEEVMKVVADEMASCWQTFGEGKLDFVGYSVWPDFFVGSYCGVCSTISFDKSLINQEFS